MQSDGNMPESFEDDFTLVRWSSMGPKPVSQATASDAAKNNVRHDWKREEVEAIYRTALPELVFRAQTSHRQYFATDRVQTCQLISIKTGGCPEDCAYCPQSAHYDAGVERQGLLDPQHVIEVARDAASRGVTRFCMGAAWRQAPEGREFENVLEMVRGVAAMRMEVCCTLGMLTEEQAGKLKDAGLTAYNHNLDTSPEFYGSIITTRVYEDRLKTLAAVRKAGITVCCGGILGMGEREADRIGLLHQLARLEPHPESVPINMLVRVEGTPLAAMPPLDPLEMVRAIATARILMPASRVRLAAGRNQLSPEAVTLCFLAGANSIFVGEKLLTTPNPGPDEDEQLLQSLGMKPLEAHAF
jgi:biotin synthase